MDLLSAYACLQLLSDLRLSGDLVSLVTPDSRQDWRRHPIQLGPGWLPLVGDMLERLLSLPVKKQPFFKYIRALDGKLEVSWHGDSVQGDMICIATQAKAEHTCQWCGARGRYLYPQKLTLCASHAELIGRKKLSDIPLAEHLQLGKAFPRRRMLIDLVVGKRTVSGLAAGLATETDEHGFDLDGAHMPAAFLNGTAAEADLVTLDVARVRQILDHGLFGMIGVVRSFQIGDAVPPIVEAAHLFDVAMTEINVLIEEAGHFDPDIRGPAFRRLAKLIKALDEREAEEV